MTCNYTRIIHSRGWTVVDACDHWNMRYDVWRRKCRKNKYKAQLICLCRGLESKSEASKFCSWDEAQKASKLMSELSVKDSE